MADTLSNPKSVQDSIEVAATTANATLESDIDLPVEKLDLDISSLKFNIQLDGAGHKERIRSAANTDKRGGPGGASGKSRGDVADQEEKKELENRKRQFRMSQLAGRRGGVPNMPSQGTAAGSLPEDINPEQQSGAGNMLRGIRNDRNQPGADQLRRKFENRQQRRNSSVLVSQGLSEGTNDMSSDLDISEDSYGDDENEDEQPLNVPEDQENDTGQQLADQRNQARQNQKGDGKNNGGTGSDMSLLTKMQIEIDTHRRHIKEIDDGISGLRRTLVMLMIVLGVALGKDIFDAVAEALSIGVWGWFDWLLDLPLVIAALILKIEKDGKEKIEGWLLSLIEVIPYVDLLPAWTGRVLKSILQRNKEIADAVRTKKKEQKKLDKALKFQQALLSLPEENK